MTDATAATDAASASATTGVMATVRRQGWWQYDPLIRRRGPPSNVPATDQSQDCSRKGFGGWTLHPRHDPTVGRHHAVRARRTQHFMVAAACAAATIIVVVVGHRGRMLVVLVLMMLLMLEGLLLFRKGLFGAPEIIHRGVVRLGPCSSTRRASGRIGQDATHEAAQIIVVIAVHVVCAVTNFGGDCRSRFQRARVISSGCCCLLSRRCRSIRHIRCRRRS